jgi:alpha-1,2-mannosyltransferase
MTEAKATSDGRRVTRWLAVALGLHLIVALLVAFALTLAGETFGDAAESTAPGHALELAQRRSAVDSWHPMLLAYHRRTTDPDARLYDLFFVERVKFQYPPSSLLMFELVPRSMTVPRGTSAAPEGLLDPRLRRWLNRLALAAVLLTVLGAAMVLEVRLARLNPDARLRWGGTALRALLAAGLGLTYYPLVKGYELGQVQVFLGCLATYAVLFHLLGWDALGGACLGLCCLVKPQYGVLLLWGVLRRRWRFALGLGGVLLLGTVVALARFGLADHLDYLRVLRAISGTGEVFWPNQSANGLAHRLLGNGDPVNWNGSAFAPPHPWVYAVTLGSSLVILGLALFPWRRRPAVPGPADLLLMLAAATLASPVAWEHHYGAFLPLFAAVLPELIRARPLGRWTAPLFAASYLAMAGAVAYPPSLFANPWTGLLASHLFFGALILFVLLLQRRRAANDSASRIPGVAGGAAHEDAANVTRQVGYPPRAAA